MKKILAVILAAMIAAYVCGCSKNLGQTNKADIPELVWYVPGSKQADMELVKEKINEILVPKIGATLDIQFIDDGAYQERMNMNMASGTVFDLCFCGYVNVYYDCIRQGGIIPLNDLINKEAPSLLKALPQYLFDAATVNGKIYAIPNNQIMAQNIALSFQKKLVDKYSYNLSDVKRNGDIEPFLKTIKDKEPDLYPFNGGTSVRINLWSMDKYENAYIGLNCLWIDKSDEQCKVIKRYDTKEFLEGIHTLRDWYNKGYIRKDVTSATGASDSQYAVSAIFNKPGLEQELEKKLGIELDTVNLYKAHMTTQGCIQTMTGVSATSKNPEKAVKIIEQVNTNAELYNLIVYGVEGKHYTKINDKYIKVIPESGYSDSGAWKFGNQFNAYITEGKPENVWEETQKQNDEATKSKLLGFAFNTKKISSEIAQCVSVTEKYSAIEDGSVDVDTFLEKYIQEMEDAGINIVKAELQSQIDEFLANKK